MLLADLVETSSAVAATRSRKAKVAAIAERLAQAEVDELPVVTAYVGGTILQRRTGVGWRGLSNLPDPADEPTVSALEVHETLGRLAAMSGSGLAGVAGRRGPRPLRPADRRRAALAARGDDGQRPAGRPRRPGPGGDRGCLGREAHRRTPRGDARGRHRADRGRRDDRRGGRARRDRARGRAGRCCRCSPRPLPTSPPPSRRPAGSRARRSRSTPSWTASGSRPTATATTS